MDGCRTNVDSRENTVICHIKVFEGVESSPTSGKGLKLRFEDHRRF